MPLPLATVVSEGLEEQEVSSSQSQPCGGGERAAPTEAEPSAAFGQWRGIGFILDFDDRADGEVAFILKVPHGEVTIRHLWLASAAPDLLAACQAMVLMYEGDTAPGDLTPITSARAAIAKASPPVPQAGGVKMRDPGNLDETDGGVRERISDAIWKAMHGYDGRLLEGDFYPGHDAIVDAAIAAIGPVGLPPLALGYVWMAVPADTSQGKEIPGCAP